MVEKTERIRVDGESSDLTLTEDGSLRWRDRGGNDKCILVEKEVLGFEEKEEVETREGRIFCTIRLKTLLLDEGKEGEGKKRVRKDFVFLFDTQDFMRFWGKKLTDYIDSLGRPKRLVVFLNPFGGKGTARNIFKNEVKPLLHAAGIFYTLQETQHKLHAQEIACKMDLLKYDGVLCVSGDGILVEVINGLLQREDWESAIKMPLGLVPAEYIASVRALIAGTGNGMVKSLLDAVGEACSVCNAVFTVVRGHKRSLDVATISQAKTLFFSALMLCWGLVADIDIESERLRWMGSARLGIYSLIRIFKLRRYNGLISFLPSPGYESCGEPSKLDKGKIIFKQVHENDKGEQCGYQGPTTCSQISEWRSIEGPFISVWLHNVPWASMDTIAAPDAKFSDGFYDLAIIKECSKYNLAATMKAMSDGSYVKLPHVIYLKVKAFRLDPGNRVDEPDKGGIIDSDGEVLARGMGTYKYGQQDDLMTYDSIQMHVEKGLATIFSP